MSRLARITPRSGGGVLVELRGELDLAVGAPLRQQLMRAIERSPDVVVDLRRVEFIDCAALGVLVGARNEAVARKGSLVLMAPPPQVRRLVELAGLGQALPTRSDVDAAPVGERPVRRRLLSLRSRT